MSKSNIKYEPIQQKMRPESAKMLIPGIQQLSDFENQIIQTQDSLNKTAMMTSNRNPISRPYSAASLNNPKLQEFQRKIPRYIKMDKESMYSELMSLRMKMNETDEENKKIKASNQLLQKEVDKLQNLVSNVESFINLNKHTKNNPNTKEKQAFNDSILAVSLKKQIQDLKKKLKEKDEELKKSRMEVKYTKLEELRVEIDASLQESMRLRTLLEQSMRNQAIVQMTQDFNSMEEKFYVQMQLINQLKQENEYISGLLRFQEDECFRLENEYQQSLKTIKEKDQDIQEYKQKLMDKTTELNGLVQKFSTVRSINQDLQNKNTKLEGNKETILTQDQMLASLEKQLNEKTLNNQYLDKTIQELKQKLADTQANEVRQKKTLQDEVAKWQSMYDELEEKYKNNLINQQSRIKETVVSMGTNFRQVFE